MDDRMLRLYGLVRCEKCGMEYSPRYIDKRCPHKYLLAKLRKDVNEYVQGIEDAHRKAKNANPTIFYKVTA